MPISQRSGTACDTTTNTDIPQTQISSRIIEQMRWIYLWANFTFCIFFIPVVIIGTTIMFCATKSPLSFSLLPLIPLFIGFRHRIENYLFPLSHEDLLLEMSRQTKQNGEPAHWSWLHYLTSKLP